MRYLFLILTIGISSCLLDNNTNEHDSSEPHLVNSDAVITRSENALVGYQSKDSITNCKVNILFKENLTLPIEINSDLFTMFNNIGEKIVIPYECINGREMDLHNGEPLNIYYPYGKFKLNDGKEYYLVIETVNPENPVDLFYTSAILFSNNNGALENGIEIGKYHAYSGVQEYYDGKLEKDGMIHQHIKKIGNDGISESVFEERDTSFNIIE